MKLAQVGPALLLAIATPSLAQRAGGFDSVIVSAGWLASHLADPSIVVLDVEREPGAYAAGHIPGARLVSYTDIAAKRDGNSSELPSVDSLRAVMERLGVSSASRVVVYSKDAPAASRAFFTLDYLGNVRVSFLDGGMAAWRRLGQPVSRSTPVVRRGTYVPHPRGDVVVDASWVLAHAGKPGIAVLDTRTDGEYVGSGERHGMPSTGHISGARQLQWEQLFSNPGESLLLPRGEMATLYAARAKPGDTVVTYCYVGYRASMTYMIARALGYPTKLYDGSYEDWARRHLPTVAGTSPMK